MAEPSHYSFNHKEVVEALLKHQGIHEGIWGLHVTFGFQVSNIGKDSSDIVPTVIVPLMGLGVQKFEEETNISVDAAKVNPKPKTTKRKTVKKKKKKRTSR